ncbi:glycoside hydrolase family protein [Nocardioides mangrovi]|uniref:Lysozyme n=1 Tax=Nocardioides mangrovi TaxID=2874580 RepID=A0ABS7U7P2_9ACTN|nr:peptidoglycan-binding protein [Nocardioides mangrovi]MBZ5736905.1 peptidoglycan-binding protein [Nocardioides mangrovi]
MDKSPTHETPWSVDDAITFLNGEKDRDTTTWKQFCLRLAARAYGYAFSNVVDANGDGDNDVSDFWNTAKKEFKHPGDRKPPVGGLAIFGNPGRFGHIATVVRSGPDAVIVLANNDLDGGRVRPLSLAQIEDSLNLEYLGWFEPNFPLGTPGNPQGLPANGASQRVFHRALFVGNTDSESVRALQRRLNEVLDAGLEVSGAYDAATKRAVARFQSRVAHFSGAGADGAMFDPASGSGGELTAKLLFPTRRYEVRAGAVPSSDHRIDDGADGHAQPDNGGLVSRVMSPDPDQPATKRPRVDLAQLVPGRKNQSVRQLQHRLNHVIDAGLDLTGAYDDATVAAVRAWQLSIGDVDDADGVLGPKQFAVLFPQRQFTRAGAPPSTLTLSPRGEDFIIEFEGFSSTLYNDQAGHCTIGVGHLVHLGNCRPTEGGLENGITRARATTMLRNDAKSMIDSVASNVKVPLTQAQFDALVSFTFNVGVGNFETSTLLKKLNDGHPEAVPTQLKRWNKVTIDGQKVASDGLTRRRGREAKLFATGVYTA